MNKHLVALFVIFTMISCSSDNDTMNEMTNDQSDSEEIKGSFVSDAHPTSGMVSLNMERTVLNLDNFKTDDGPKLLLYLSTNVDSQDFVNLGDLKGIEGDFQYNIPANTDLGRYKFVVVWCVDFSVSFGHAELK